MRYDAEFLDMSRHRQKQQINALILSDLKEQSGS